MHNHHMQTKNILPILFFSVMTLTASSAIQAATDVIGKNTPALKSDLLTPEALWAFGRVGEFRVSPDGREAVYNVGYYSVEQNKGHHVLYFMSLPEGKPNLLTTDAANETGAVYIDKGRKLLFMSNRSGSSQLWTMNADGSERKQLSDLPDGIEGFLLSPDESKIIVIRQVESHSSIEKKYDDLPKATGMVINDMMYKHWDTFVTSVPHPFLADFSLNGLGTLTDLLDGEPYECPMLPFGGTEQLCWSPDSKSIAYTCRKKTGKKYAVSTDSDIFLYDIASGTTRNLCKPADYKEPKTDDTRSLANQPINQQEKDCNVGYDTNPSFSPNGRYVAWQSMERAGYESDRNRLCVYEMATGKKTYTTETFQSGVDTYLWGADSKTLYFSGVWHGTSMLYSTNLSGRVEKLTDGTYDYSLAAVSPDGKELYAKRHSMSEADDIFRIKLKKNHPVSRVTDENRHLYNQLTFGKVEERWITTVDGKKEQTWIIYPPHFDPNKKYPTLLFCEGGPQSPLSQFWSYRWNFQIMAAHGYIVVAPNRRGVPGYGMEWLEAISGDYPGLCMKDYLSAIDEMAKEPYVDNNRLGCVGASFGGYSVYWLAGHHNKRFKCFIAHDGIYNTEQQYVETEEMWFANWDLKSAPWNKGSLTERKAYEQSPHYSIDKWDTPILCIHGMKDYRILHSQAESAFNAARLRGIDAQLLLYPDENHWVLKPQNAILWQRTFFNWLDKWLK